MWEEEEGVKEAGVKAGKLKAGRLDTDSVKEGDGFGRSLLAYKGLFTIWVRLKANYNIKNYFHEIEQAVFNQYNKGSENPMVRKTGL